MSCFDSQNVSKLSSPTDKVILHMTNDNRTMLRMLRMVRNDHVARMEDIRDAYKVLVGKPEGKKLLWSYRRRCEDNIKIDLMRWPPLWFSNQSFWRQIQRSRVRFPALPDILRSRGSGTGSTQPREDN
jgi:hypothetical protein